MDFEQIGNIVYISGMCLIMICILGRNYVFKVLETVASVSIIYCEQKLYILYKEAGPLL